MVNAVFKAAAMELVFFTATHIVLCFGCNRKGKYQNRTFW